MKLFALDTTLRDGAQGGKISYSVLDKLKIAHLLDDFGVDYIEAGNPGSNPKDAELFEKLSAEKFNHAKIAAFGSTRRVGVRAEEDGGLKLLAGLPVPVCVIFGKAWDLQVTDVLATSLSENLSMIYDSVKYLKQQGKEVIFDAEHFFDGYKNNPEYALKAIKTAEEAGADVVCLCDTTGGAFPDEIQKATEAAHEALSCQIGIHTHNDTGMAVAGAVFAITGGAVHIQGTMIGSGERCGNANLASLIANLQLKKGYDIVPAESMQRLTPVCRAIAEISNVSIGAMPYVSKSAFAHKAGMHIDGVLKNPSSFEHIDPMQVGNDRSFLISDVAGKSVIYEMLVKFMPDIKKDSPEVKAALTRLKQLEHEGYQFEAAPASFELEAKKALGLYTTPYFDLDRLRLIIEQNKEHDTDGYSSAFIKLLVKDDAEITAADSTSGPVHAMDIAVRKALERFYPDLADIRLTDYKVRVIDSEYATAAKVRVLIESADSHDSWTTVGVSTDIIMASKKALLDSLEYALLKREK